MSLADWDCRYQYLPVRERERERERAREREREGGGTERNDKAQISRDSEQL